MSDDLNPIDSATSTQQTVIMKIAISLTLLAACFLPHANAATYNCSTEFGESVPLRISATRAGKPAPDLSRSWNEAVRENENLKSKIKSEELIFENEKLAFEWRYAKRPGPSFAIEVQCPKEGKCAGKFLNSKDASALTLETKLFDQRSVSQRGYVQLHLSDREELALRIRVFKETGERDTENQLTLSASGEHMILALAPRFIIDVGVDEHLKLSKNVGHRLAALEIKVRCNLSN